VQGGERKLVIGHAARSYVALYHYIDALDTAFVLAVRSQLDAGSSARFEAKLADGACGVSASSYQNESNCQPGYACQSCPYPFG